MLTAAAFQHTNRHVRHHLHRLGTRRPASTVPGARRPPVTTARASSSALLAEIVTGLAGIAERFATALDCVDTGFLADGVLDQLPTGSRLGATRIGGVDLNKPRMRDALRAALALAPAPNGFTVAEFAAKVHAITGTSDADYTIRQAGYDLRKLRGKQLLDKPARTRRYQLDAPAARTIAALLTLRDQVIAPILAAVRSPRMGRKPAHWTRVDRDYERIRLDLQTLFNDVAIETPLAA